MVPVASENVYFSQIDPSLLYLLSLSTELWCKAPLVYINGKEVWDGGGALSGQQQTGLLLQWNSAPDPDHTDTESPHGALVDLPDVCELKNRPEEFHKEEMHEDVLESLRYINQMEAPAASVCDGDVGVRVCLRSESDMNLSESAFRCLEETNDGDPVMNESAFPNIEYQSHSDIDNMLSAFNQLDADAETGVYDEREVDRLTHPSADIFPGFDSDALGRPVFDLAALLADSQQVNAPAEPIGWHFPVGLGLSQMCYCPYVQFPDVSYYPALQDNDSIEGGNPRFTLQKHQTF